jgi:hypothetical protein
MLSWLFVRRQMTALVVMGCVCYLMYIVQLCVL